MEWGDVAKPAGPSSLDDLIDAHSTRAGVPRDLLAALIKQESGGNPNAVNAESGATGLGQLMPATAKSLGVKDRTDPDQSVKAAADYLGQGLKRYGGDVDSALRYYYGGPNEKMWGPRTQAYPDQVKRHLPKQEAAADPWADLAKPVSEKAEGISENYEKSSDPWDAIAAPVAAEPPKSKKPMFSEDPLVAKAGEVQPSKPGVLSDVGETLKSGAITTGRNIRDLTQMLGRNGLLPGYNPDRDDAMTKKLTGATVGEHLEGWLKASAAKLSPEQTAANAKKWWDDEKGTFGEAWSDPRSYMNGIVSSLPETFVSMIPGGILARAAFVAKRGAMTAAGATAKEAAKEAGEAAAKAAGLAGQFTEGTLGGVQSHREVSEAIMKMTPEQLQQSEAFRALVAKGMTAEEARNQLATDGGTQAFWLGGIATGIFGGMGDKFLARAISGTVTGGVMKRMAKGAVAEGLLEEFPQSGLQKIGQNVAMLDAKPGQVITEGALNEALGGMVAGTTMGAAFGVPGGRGAADALAPGAAAGRPSGTTGSDRQDPTIGPTDPNAPIPAEDLLGRVEPETGSSTAPPPAATQPGPASPAHNGDMTDPAAPSAGSDGKVTDPLAPLDFDLGPGQEPEQEPLSKRIEKIMAGNPEIQKEIEEREAELRGAILKSVLNNKEDHEPTSTFGKRIGGEPTREELQEIQFELRLRKQKQKEAEAKAAAEQTAPKDSARPQSPAAPAPKQEAPATTATQSSAPPTTESAKDSAAAVPTLSDNAAKTGTPPITPPSTMPAAKGGKTKPKGPPEPRTPGQVNNRTLKRWFGKVGINKDEIRDITGEKHWRKAGGTPTTWRNPKLHAGIGIDDWAERLHKAGWLPAESQSERGNENARASVEDARDFIRRVMAGEEVHKIADQGDEAARKAALEHDDWIAQEASRMSDAMDPANLMAVEDPELDRADHEDAFDAAAALVGLPDDVKESILERAAMQAQNEGDYAELVRSFAETERRRNEGGEGARAGAEETEAGGSVSRQGDREGPAVGGDPANDEAVTVDAAAHEAASSPNNDKPEPTKEQILAGNAELGHERIRGLDISFENPEGSVREDKQNDPPKWRTTMRAHYGYFRGTVGVDKDHIDVFIKPGTPKDYDGPVFVIDQKNAKGLLDEHKVMLGWPDSDSARDAYLAHYPKGWNGIGAISPTNIDGLKDWLANGDTTKQFAMLPIGVTEKELEQIADEFRELTEGAPDHRIFMAPKKDEIVRLHEKAGAKYDPKAKVWNSSQGWMTPEEAKARIKSWKEHARAQGESGANSGKVVLSLFDLTGEWSKPWAEAGYDVYRFDIQDDPETGDVNNFSVNFFGDWFGDFDGRDIHAILAACPCTDFAASGAKHFAAKDADGRTRSSVELVKQTLSAIEYFKPSVWALENPVGRIERLTGLPPWRSSSDPFLFGDPYTKRTLLWGRHNADMPIAPVDPVEGSKMWSQYGGKSQETKNARSATPEGFAYAFFMANNAVDHPVMAVANKYDRLHRPAVEAAVNAGATEAQISEAVDDFYYMDLDDGQATQALYALAAELLERADEAAEAADKNPVKTPVKTGETAKGAALRKPKGKAAEKAAALAEQQALSDAHWAKQREKARAYWKVGMVTSLGAFAEIEGDRQQYTQMLPGVIEAIDGDTASVRIYAAPEYGYTLENYPLHGKLAVNVRLIDLGEHHGNTALEKIVAEGKLDAGDPEVAAAVRERNRAADALLNKPRKKKADETEKGAALRKPKAEQLDLGAPAAPIKTPGTRIEWVDVTTWLEELAKAVAQNKTYGSHYNERTERIRRHWDALADSQAIEQETSLATLKQLREATGSSYFTPQDSRKTATNDRVQPRAALIDRIDRREKELTPKAERQARDGKPAAQSAQGAQSDAKSAPSAPPTEVTVFASGMSRIPDLTAALKENAHVGVETGELSDNAIAALAEGMATSDSLVFVDSGAFSIFRANQRNKNDAQFTLEEFGAGGKALDFAEILDRMEQLQDAVAKASPDGAARHRLRFVMPDIVGDQAGSLALLKEHASQINDAFDMGQAIFPLQAGEKSLTEMFDAATTALIAKGTGNPPHFIVGIPSNKMAAPPEQVEELLRKRGAEIEGVHFLGAGSRQKLEPLIAAVRAAGFDGDVSGDSTIIRQKISGAGDRAAALREALRDRSPTETAKGAALRDAPALELSAPTPAELQAKADAEKAATAKADAEKAAAEKAERDERIRKEVRDRSAAAADSFVLGGSAEANLSGQTDIFGAAAPEPTPPAPAGQNNSSEKNAASSTTPDSVIPAESSANKRHAIAKADVLTPAGSIKAEARDSRAPSSIWFYQGDMGQLQFTANVMIGGQPDPGAQAAKKLLEQIKAVQAAGWSRVNYRAGSYGTVWVYERGNEFLTRAGMENATASALQRPDMPGSIAGFKGMALQQIALAKAIDDWLNTMPEEQQLNRGVVSRKMGETPVGEWARIEDEGKLGIGLRYYDSGAVHFTIQIIAEDWPRMRALVRELAARAAAAQSMDEGELSALMSQARDASTKPAGNNAPVVSDPVLQPYTNAEILAKEEADKAAAKDTAPRPEALLVQPRSMLDGFKTFFADLFEGKATLEQYQAGYRSVRDGKPGVVAELNAMKKDEIRQMFGILRDEKKEGLVEIAYNSMVRQFALGKEYGPTSYFMGAHKQYEIDKQQALDALVAGQTAEDLAAFVADRKRGAEERVEKQKAIAEAVANPTTLQEFRDAVRYHMGKLGTNLKARLALTLEQRALYDDLTAQDHRKNNPERKKADIAIQTAGQTVGGQIIETKHTQKGHDLFVVQLEERVSREDYNTLNTSAKRLGGYYSSFRGRGAVPGFQFTTRENAQAFVELAGGNAAAAQAAAQERRDSFDDDRSQSAVERLNEMADRLDERADESLGRDRKENTDRRARMAASAEASANGDKALAGTMRKIAEAITNGTTKYLDRVRAKTQVELLKTLLRNARDAELRTKYESYADREKQDGVKPTMETVDFAEWPAYSAMRSDLAYLARQMVDTDGTKLIGERLLKFADDVSSAYTAWVKEPGNVFKVTQFQHGDRLATFANRDAAERAIKRSRLSAIAVVYPEKRGVNRIILSPSEAIKRGVWQGDGDPRLTLDVNFATELIEKVGKANRRGARVSLPWALESAYERRKQLARIGIYSPAEMRAALREFVGLLQAPAPVSRIKELERAMIGRANDGLDFFPTPESTADAMVEAAGIEPGMAVLEPSAGWGHIADRIREAGVDPDVIEISNNRRELLREKGYNVVGTDFLGLKERGFTYGDTFQAPDGRQGIMRGLGGMGSGRVRLVVDNDERTAGYYDRDELTPIKRNGTDSGYDRILMNPPFSDGRDIIHVRHAYSLLKPGGRLVAIMGEGTFFQSNARAEEFRSWLESVGGTEESLPAGTFNDPTLPVTTGVNARMVVIERSASPYASAQTAETVEPMTPKLLASIEATIKRARAKIRFPIVTHYDSPTLLHPNLAEDTGGAYWHGVVHVWPRNVASLRDLQRILVHEIVGHAGMMNMMGREKYKELADIILKAKRLGNREVMRLAEIVRQTHGPALVGPEAELIEASEILAAAAERGIDASGNYRPGYGWLKEIVAKIAAWLRDAGFSVPFTLSEMQGLLIRSARYVAETPAMKAAQTEAALQAGARPTWYSPLKRAIAEMKRPVGTGKEWGLAIVKLPGVKPEELQWSGLQEWLELQTGKVTKEQILEYLDANGVQVSEAVLDDRDGEVRNSEVDRLTVELTALGYQPDIDYEGRLEGVIGGRTHRDADSSYYTYKGDGSWIEADTGDPMPADAAALATRIGDLREAIAWASEQGDGPPASGTKFSKWTLPGGENYREVLLTLPPHRDMRRYNELADRREQHGTVSPEEEAELGELHERARRATLDNVFRSSHFDQPNIVAHIRVNDRTDAEGKRVLFVEEFQSDWAEQGRDRGFVSPATVYTVARETREHLRGPDGSMPWAVLRDGVPTDSYDTEAAAEAAADNNRNGRERFTVPAGPYVQKTEAWVTLALRRAILMAIDGGYDRVAWTTGEQQNDRYQLAPLVDHVKYSEGMARLWGTKDGHTVINEGGITPEKLQEYLGKELAVRMMMQEPVRGTNDSLRVRSLDKFEVEWRELSGLQLKIGGEAMRAFYDRMVPNIANDVLKKLGGGRVGSTRIATQHPFVFDPAAAEVVDRGGVFQVWADGKLYGGNHESRAEAEAYAKTGGRMSQPSFDITPAMIEKAAGGMPLMHRAYHGTPYTFDRFSTDRIGSGEGAQVYGWGLYFAGAQEVGRHYREALTHRGFVYDGEYIANPDAWADAIADAEKVDRGAVQRMISDFRAGESAQTIALRAEKQFGKDAAAQIFHIAKGLERATPGISLQPKRGKRDIDAMTDAERSAYYDMMGSSHWYKQDVAVAELRKLAESTIKAQRTYLDSEYETERTEAPRLIAENEEKLRVIEKYDLQMRGIPKGSLYEVELAPKEEDYLDWDKPISQQSPKVRKAIKGLGKWGDYESGANVYKGLAVKLGTQRMMGPVDDPARQWGPIDIPDDKAASLRLKELGIPGIRYLDGQSRNKTLKDLKREFLAELPEDADFDEVLELADAGKFSPENARILKALEADSWLGFDYPAQAISAALGNNLQDFDPSQELRDAIAAAQGEVNHNFVIFDENDVEITQPLAAAGARRAATARRFTEKEDGTRTTMLDALGRKLGGEALSKYLLQPTWNRLVQFGSRIIPHSAKVGIGGYDLPEPYMHAAHDRSAAINSQLRDSKSLLDSITNLDRNQSRIAYEWMTTVPNVDIESELLAQLPEDARTVLRDMKLQISDLGRRAVDVGLLSPETYERNNLAYLRRSYEKYEKGLDAVGRAKRTRAIALRGDNFKKRGLRDDAAMTQIYQDDRIRREAGQADTSLKGKKFIRVERRGQPTGTANLDGMTGESLGPLREIAYVPAEAPIPARFSGWRVDGEWEARFYDKPGKIGMWRDFTADEQKKMGVIDEVRYSFARTMLNMVHDVETAQFLKWVSTQYGKLTEDDVTEAGGHVVVKDVVDAQTTIQTFKSDEWVKVPELMIGGTKIRKYGELAGRYIPGPLWNDIRSTINSRGGELTEVWDKMMITWKLSKTALSVPVHMNNVMSNIIMADLADVRSRDLAKAFLLMRRFAKKDPDAMALMHRYQDSGAELGGMLHVDLRRDVMEPYLAQLEELADEPGESMGRLAHVSQIMSLVLHGKLIQAFHQTMMTTPGKLAKKPIEFMLELYNKEDTVFRLAAFLKSVEEGKTDRAAGELARKAFLDYRITAPWVQMARRSFLPFIAFSYRAMPLLIDGYVKTPWKIMKYAGIAGGLNALAYAFMGIGDDDEERERRLLPDELRGRTALGIPRMQRMPWNDDHGSPVFLDIRRWIPAGDIADTNNAHGVLALPGWLGLGGPLAALAEFFTNTSLFTGKPITNPSDTTTEKAAKIADWQYKFWLPNTPNPIDGLGWGVEMMLQPAAPTGTMQSYSTTKLRRSMTGETDKLGRDLSTTEAALSSVGVKVASYPADTMTGRAVSKAGREEREIAEAMNDIRRQHSRGGLSDTAAGAKIRFQQEKLEQVQRGLSEKLGGK